MTTGEDESGDDDGDNGRDHGEHGDDGDCDDDERLRRRRTWSRARSCTRPSIRDQRRRQPCSRSIKLIKKQHELSSHHSSAAIGRRGAPRGASSFDREPVGADADVDLERRLQLVGGAHLRLTSPPPASISPGGPSKSSSSWIWRTRRVAKPPHRAGRRGSGSSRS